MTLVQDRGAEVERRGTEELCCRDWRALATHQIAPLLEAEMAAWRSTLAWDVRDAWQSIEPARLSGRLPGLVVADGSGRLRGWTCFLDHHGVLQVATLVADTSAATATLVREIVISEATQTRMQVVCVRAAAPRLGAELATHGFSVASYRYLCRDLGLDIITAPGLSVDPMARGWHAGDLEPSAALCARAYDGAGDIRAFAPGGSPAEWLEYVSTLVEGSGCGRLIPTASFVVDAGSTSPLDAAILTTDLGVRTAHIAQVVVDPASQRRGLGRALLAAATTTATTLGFERISLLVAESNARAMSLYYSSGFKPKAKFIVGVRNGAM